MADPPVPDLLRPFRLALCCALALGLAACEENVPPTSADGSSFTIWGQLDPTVATQAVRVEPIAPTIDGIAEIGATVESEDLVTGEVTPWRDSLITFADGSRGHVFLADYQPPYGARVEFRVVRDGETATSARVTVPPLVTPFFGEVSIGVRSTVDLVLPGAPRVVGADVAYDLLSDAGDFLEFVEVDPSLVTSIDFGWRVTIDFSRQVEVLRGRFRQRDINGFDASLVRVRGAVASEEWAAPFPFPFSPAFVIQPGTVSNVRGGFGFLGAAYAFDVPLEVGEDVLNRLGL